MASFEKEGKMLLETNLQKETETFPIETVGLFNELLEGATKYSSQIYCRV